MKVFVRAKPNSKENRVVKIDETHFQVRVKAPAAEGKANEAVCEALAGYFKIPKSLIRLTRGGSSKEKVFEIPR